MLANRWPRGCWLNRCNGSAEPDDIVKPLESAKVMRGAYTKLSQSASGTCLLHKLPCLRNLCAGGFCAYLAHASRNMSSQRQGLTSHMCRRWPNTPQPPINAWRALNCNDVFIITRWTSMCERNQACLGDHHTSCEVCALLNTALYLALGSASSKMMAASLPPSSRVNLFKLSLDAFWIALPAVKAKLLGERSQRMRTCDEKSRNKLFRLLATSRVPAMYETHLRNQYLWHDTRAPLCST